MSFNVVLYNFLKRDNSTAVPEPGGTLVVGDLKEESGLVRPTIKIAFEAGGAPNYNYAFISTFSRYYWINEWTFNEGFWFASMMVDPLASWRTIIGNTSQYVLRASAEHDGEVIDKIYPVTTLCKRVECTGETPFKTARTLGCYVMGVLSNAPNGIGSTTYYALTETQFRAFNELLMRDIDWLNIDFDTISDMNEQFLKTLFNPYQYVMSCYWFPFSQSELEGVTSTGINYGWWTLLTDCKRLTSTKKITNCHISGIPQHPQASRGRYMNYSPFTSMKLHFPPFGTFDIDPTIIDGATRVANFQIAVDLVTGEGTLYVRTMQKTGIDESALTNSAISSQIGVPIQVSQMGINMTKLAGTFIGGALGAIGSGLSLNFGGMLGGIASTVQQSSEAMLKPEIGIIGGNGNFTKYAAIDPIFAIMVTFWFASEDDNTKYGRPLNKTRAPKDIPGFILCDNASIATNGTKEETEMIRNYLNGGFYYE